MADSRPNRFKYSDYDHRGAMIRVLGGVDDLATRLENRVGEPAANPYLYILAQIVTGLAGIETGAALPPSSDEPYTAERPLLPKSLPEALDALDAELLFRRALGDIFVDYFVKLKRTEAGRYQSSLQGASPGDDRTDRSPSRSRYRLSRGPSGSSPMSKYLPRCAMTRACCGQILSSANSATRKRER